MIAGDPGLEIAQVVPPLAGSVGPLRLALVIPTLDQSGAEKQLTRLAVGLAAQGHAVKVFCLTRGGPYESELRGADIEVQILHKRWKFDPFALARLGRALAHYQPDIVHTWLFAANAYGRLVRNSIPHAKFVVSERCVDSWKAGWQKWLDRKLIPRTDCLVGNSPSVARFYGELGVPEHLLHVIPNGITSASTLLTDDRLQARAVLRSRCGFPADAYVIGFVGRMATQKRLEDLIWAIETLRQIRPSLRGVFVGDGPLADKLKAFATDVGCNNHVFFAGHQSSVADWIAGCDGFWLASSFEGMSNSLMEAMLLGLPVVVSDIAANTELVTHFETGLVVKTGDRAGYIQAARLLMDDPPLRDRLGAAARNQMLTQYSESQMVSRYIELYEGLVRPR